MHVNRSLRGCGPVLILVICIILVLGVLGALMGCKNIDDPPPPITTKYALLCIDIETQVRYQDSNCQFFVDGYRWAYVKDDLSWDPHLPSLGQRLENGRYTWDRPAGVAAIEISRVDERGSEFSRER